MLMIGLAFCFLSNLGCQTFCPFAKKTRDNLVLARQSASGGLKAFHDGRLDQAKSLLFLAAEQNPSDPSVRENLARALYNSGDHQQAILQMQLAVDLSKGDPRLIVELGEMYLDVGQWIPARRQVELALAVNHRFAPAWALSGRTEKAKGNYREALADFQKALGFEPDMLPVQMLVVDTYQAMKEPHRALSAIEQILNKHPSDAIPEQLVVAKSVALMDLNQLRPAIDLLQTASNKKNASSEVFIQLSRAQLQAEQDSDARASLVRGQQAFPNLALFDQLLNDLQSDEPRVASTGHLTVR